MQTLKDMGKPRSKWARHGAVLAALTDRRGGVAVAHLASPAIGSLLLLIWVH